MVAGVKDVGCYSVVSFPTTMALKSSRLWLVSPFWRPYVGLTFIASCDVGRSTQVHDTSDCDPCSCRLELELASQGPAQETAGYLEFLWACRLIQVAFCVGVFYVLEGGGGCKWCFFSWKPKGPSTNIVALTRYVDPKSIYTNYAT